jgi:hypothetical protein
MDCTPVYSIHIATIYYLKVEDSKINIGYLYGRIYGRCKVTVKNI